jgi:hypothetical protein
MDCMLMTRIAMNSTLSEVLLSSGPDAAMAEKLGLYGQFAGSWKMRIQAYEDSGTCHQSEGEIHFGWVLGGCAIQDVWITPSRSHRRRDMPPAPVTGNWYGTTLRIYDPAADAWDIFWMDPVTRIFTRQVGRADGANIVQLGEFGAGLHLRWMFSEIEANAFRWTGDVSTDKGDSWRPQVDIRARRT